MVAILQGHQDGKMGGYLFILQKQNRFHPHVSQSLQIILLLWLLLLSELTFNSVMRLVILVILIILVMLAGSIVKAFLKLISTYSKI